MNIIWTIAVKDLRLLFRERSNVFFILIMPVVMGIFFGTVMGGPSAGSQDKSIPVAIVDEDQSEYSSRFCDQLRALGPLDTQTLDRETAINEVRKGKLIAMIGIPAGFGKTAGLPWLAAPTVEIGADPSRRAESAMLEGMVMQCMGSIIGERMFESGPLQSFTEQWSNQVDGIEDPDLRRLFDSLEGLADSLEKLEAAKRDSGTATDSQTEQPKFEMKFVNLESIDVLNQRESSGQQELLTKIRSSWDLSFPQAMVWAILGCTAGFAISIVRERQRGTLERLTVAPTTHLQILAGKGLGCFLALIGVLTLLTILGCLLGMRPRDPFRLFISTWVIAFGFVGIMMLLSVMGKTEEAVSGGVWAVSVLMAMLGGGMIPLMFLPDSIRLLSNLSPVKWAVLALEGAIWRGFSFAELMVPWSILCVVGVCCTAIGTYRLQRQTE